jgi:hypothetical protein
LRWALDEAITFLSYFNYLPDQRQASLLIGFWCYGRDLVTDRPEHGSELAGGCPLSRRAAVDSGYESQSGALAADAPHPHLGRVMSNTLMTQDESFGGRMNDHRPVPPSEQPKVEPEIIPPGAPDYRQARIWLSADDRRTHFVHIETRSAFAIALALLMLGVVFAALLALLLGVVLLWIPLALGSAVAVVLSWLFRGPRR